MPEGPRHQPHPNGQNRYGCLLRRWSGKRNSASNDIVPAESATDAQKAEIWELLDTTQNEHPYSYRKFQAEWGPYTVVEKHKLGTRYAIESVVPVDVRVPTPKVRHFGICKKDHPLNLCVHVGMAFIRMRG
jgi:hypothetical protein